MGREDLDKVTNCNKGRELIGYNNKEDGLSKIQ
jgi:hypothetical protein